MVKKIESELTAAELAKIDYESRGKDLEKINEEVINEYLWFLENINKHPEHTPIGVSWFEKSLPKPEKKLKLHKVFFTGLTKEEKDLLFKF
ncbi:hypothetical protein LC087_02495 [Bacillus carboniphilus]|uniref:Uncharacterized protein n=1 Tax=Bacillus carboniphilus TaxID=86663 RepID=A0ABY9JX66_9BACI|nr:hypothetical protein [Bacillus carboniphilus]WLR43097.1 hypothetical protein LC087_02495 [Bacillus carboniphilus]